MGSQTISSMLCIGIVLNNYSMLKVTSRLSSEIVCWLRICTKCREFCT
jgi:hypothetical protein